MDKMRSYISSKFQWIFACWRGHFTCVTFWWCVRNFWFLRMYLLITCIWWDILHSNVVSPLDLVLHACGTNLCGYELTCVHNSACYMCKVHKLSILLSDVKNKDLNLSIQRWWKIISQNRNHLLIRHASQLYLICTAIKKKWIIPYIVL